MRIKYDDNDDQVIVRLSLADAEALAESIENIDPHGYEDQPMAAVFIRELRMQVRMSKIPPPFRPGVRRGA